MKLTIPFQEIPRPLSIEWRWTGFTPAKLLLNADMRQTLRYLGSIPRQGVRYVRIHNLLDLVTGKGMDTPKPRYNWSQLDEGLDVLVENGMVPFFELMGNPSNFFTDFQERAQAEAWKQLVRDLARHCGERYGRAEVEQWWFETWNEPDCGWWKQSIENFLIYYDACSEGLKEANPSLRFGGPGTAITLSAEIKALLAHVDSGTNHLTGRKDVRMDFLSVHEKGAWFSPDDIPVSPERMLEGVRRLRAYLKKNHPRLLSLPLMNNECDPQVGWKTPHTWRATPFYAAIMAKGLFLHYDQLVDADGCDFTFFGNDNGFVGDWPQRTQLTRIGLPNKDPAFFTLIKKPALNLLTALSLAGDRRVPVRADGDNAFHSLATLLPGEEGAALFLAHADNRARTGGTAIVEVQLEGLRPGPYTLVQYRIDEFHGNPYRAWEDRLPLLFIQKWCPAAEDLEALRQEQELTRFAEITEIEVGPDGIWKSAPDLPLPSLHVVLLLCKDACAPPAGVTALRAEPYEGVHPDQPILVSWKPPQARSVVDHHVEWRAHGQSAWQEIPHPPLLDGSLVHTVPGGSPVPEYRVTPVDAWGRTGPTVTLP
ncbi:MAG: hypothetical protein JJU00_00255 [Opitutales bacterium]|nr:hypothetical protein [Opitutales bacterium]